MPTASLCQGRYNEEHIVPAQLTLTTPVSMRPGDHSSTVTAPFAPLQPVSNAMAGSPPSPPEAWNCLDRNHG